MKNEKMAQRKVIIVTLDELKGKGTSEEGV